MKMKSSKLILTIKTKKELFKKEEGIISSIKEKEYQVIEVENKQIGYTLIQKLIEMQIEEFKMELVPLSMIIKEKVV